MRLTPIFSEDVASNVYILQDEKSLMIDASVAPNLENLDYLVLTHCHFDHVAMAKEIQDKTGCRIMMSDVEAEFFDSDRYESSASNFFSFQPDLGFKINKRLGEGDKIDLGSVRLKVILTPGHTPGGLSLYEPKNKLLFSGDTIFSQGFGRYDLSGGDREKLKKSIEKLSKLDVSELYPGHGPALDTGVNEYMKSIRV
jgi:glyoxylase-like metal-dependent hydrolase (beta-lactamase superfamily II)